MKKLLTLLKETHYFNYIAMLIIAIFLGITVWLSWNNFPSYWTSIKDLAINIFKYLSTLFYEIKRSSPFTSIDFSVLEKSMFSINGYDWAAKIKAFFVMIFNGHNLAKWGFFILSLLIRLLQIVIYVSAPAIILWMTFKSKYFRLSLSRNLDQKSALLILWEKVYDKIILPIKTWLQDFFLFFYYRRIYFVTFVVIALFGSNVLKAVIDLFSWFFFFVVTPLALHSIIELLLVLLIDLLPFLMKVPLFAYLIIAYVLFRYFSKRNAIRRLRHMDMMNKGFVKSRGSALMWVGTVGTGKTQTMTDFLLCTEEIFRDELFSIIKKSELRFPAFPWAKLERSLHVEINARRIINRVGAKDYVSKLEEVFYKSPDPKLIFDYDYEKYGYEYFDGLYIEKIWDRMKIYAMAYFCYILNTPLAAANYGIRFRYSRMYEGHFVLYNYDYLSLDNRYLDNYSKFVKVVPMDDMRRTRFMIPENLNRYTLDCCVIGLNEIGKERKNAPELEDTDRSAEEANQKNDGFNLTIKYVRHISMIDNKAFYRVYMDDQRPTSTNADLRELADAIFDMGKAVLSEQKIAIRMWWFEPMICEWIINKRNEIHYRFRFNRSDQTLLIRFWGWLAKMATKYMEMAINNYGYKTQVLAFTDGDLSGEYQKHPYYFINKKMRPKTYATDTAGMYFENEFRKAKRGFNDLRTFSSERASVEDLEATEGYVWKELKDMSKVKLFGNKAKTKKGKKK